jgi:8-oxo-dGTP pyrophosphatase MutT (NUDIX family)
MKNRTSAGILLIKNGKLLLQHRTADAPTNPNLWGCFGGGVDEGESPTEAVKREALEELEYVLKNPRLIDTETYVDKLGEQGGVTHTFVEEYDGSPLVLHEGQAYGWFTLDEALQLPMPEYRRSILARLGNQIFEQN